MWGQWPRGDPKIKYTKYTLVVLVTGKIIRFGLGFFQWFQKCVKNIEVSIVSKHSVENS